MPFTTKEISSTQRNIDKIVEEQLEIVARVENTLANTKNLSQEKADLITKIIERHNQNN